MKVLSNIHSEDLPYFDEFKKEIYGMWSGRPIDLADDITDVANQIWQDEAEADGEMDGDDLILYVDFDDISYEIRCNIHKVGRGTYEVERVMNPVAVR